MLEKFTNQKMAILPLNYQKQDRKAARANHYKRSNIFKFGCLHLEFVNFGKDEMLFKMAILPKKSNILHFEHIRLGEPLVKTSNLLIEKPFTHVIMATNCRKVFCDGIVEFSFLFGHLCMNGKASFLIDQNEAGKT